MSQTAEGFLDDLQSAAERPQKPLTFRDMCPRDAAGQDAIAEMKQRLSGCLMGDEPRTIVSTLITLAASVAKDAAMPPATFLDWAKDQIEDAYFFDRMADVADMIRVAEHQHRQEQLRSKDDSQPG